jgi:YesN/AraC family two-component response regulator
MKLKEAIVLFVEDEPLLRESMGVWLAQRVGRALCAEHGAEALEILAANRIDLVLTDVRMPVMDGLTLVKRLKENELPPRVILITGFSDIAVAEAYKMGIDAIVEKPIDRDELFRALQRCLENANSPGAS